MIVRKAICIVLWSAVLAGLMSAAWPNAPGPALAFEGDGAGLRGLIRERLQKRLLERQAEDAAAGAPETDTIAGLDVAVWRPALGETAPLVIFSHGFHGCNTQTSFLMRALARHGYLVIAPNHRDAGCVRGGLIASFKPRQPFRKPALWTDATFADRRDDVVNLIAGLRTTARWSSMIDWNNVALAGHSLGGYTVLGLAGAWPSWKLEGVQLKAVLALSPYCAPYIEKGSLGSMDVPVMYQGGTRDWGITPSVMKPGGAYDQTRGPASLIEFDGANHFAFTDRGREHQDSISHYALAFLDAFLSGGPVGALAERYGTASVVRNK